MKIVYNFAFQQAIMCISIFVLTSKKLLCQTPNINVPADYLLPIMSDYTLIARKQSTWLLTYTLHT